MEFESWLEQEQLILLDFDPDVVGIASQPFWLYWHDGKKKRRHAPDYFVRLADGCARVVDVPAEDQVDERTAEAFAATERACSAIGWEFRHVGVPDPALMANLRWLPATGIRDAPADLRSQPGHRRPSQRRPRC